MPAINYTDVYGDPATVPVPLTKSSKHGGRVRHHWSTLTLASAALDAGAQIFIGRFPANAVLKTSSTIHHEDFTTATDWNVGGTENGNDLADAVNLAAAGMTALLADVAPADMGKELWQLLGLAANPGGTLELVATCVIASTHAGNKTISFEIDYVVD